MFLRGLASPLNPPLCTKLLRSLRCDACTPKKIGEKMIFSEKGGMIENKIYTRVCAIKLRVLLHCLINEQIRRSYQIWFLDSLFVLYSVYMYKFNFLYMYIPGFISKTFMSIVSSKIIWDLKCMSSIRSVLFI